MELIIITTILSTFTGAWVGGKLANNSQIDSLKKLLAKSEENLARKNGDLAKKNTDINLQKNEIGRLSKIEIKFDLIRKNLRGSAVVKDYYQPVILLGPRAVGKSSLIAQWHTPWIYSNLNPTQRHKISEVPIYDFKKENTEPHFADPEILTDVHLHLKLKVHDFPGELTSQISVIEQAIDETESLRKITNKSLGVVLVCIFNAEEATVGLSQSTIEYYNGDLFKNLRSLVSCNEVNIDRLILVFNKYDLLKKNYLQEDDKLLLSMCLRAFKSIISPLKGVCNPEKVCEVFTVLSRGEEMLSNNRGASIVKGEAARIFIKSMAGEEAVKETIKDNASTFAARFF
jgi:GTPase SAR1 family protein